MNMKYALLTGILVVLATIVFLVFHHASPAAAPVPQNDWKIFTRGEAGVTFEYPANILSPDPADAIATSTFTFSFVNPSPQAATAMIVSATPTDAPDAATYIAANFQLATGLASSTVFQGIPAVAVFETAYAYETLYVVHDGAFYTFSLALSPADTERMLQSVTFLPYSPSYVGNITGLDGGYSYFSPKYGIRFSYPAGWYVGDNHLGYGTFQLYNYDVNASQGGKDSFSAGEAKIEMAISDTPGEAIDPSEGTSTSIVLPGGTQYLDITAYAGDSTTAQAAFTVFDNIVKSLRFGQ